MHFYGILSHGITPPVEIDGFESFLKDFWWPLVEDQLTPELIKAALRMSALELIESGVTSVSDILEAPKTVPGILKKEAEIIEELGLRAELSIESSERVLDKFAKLALQENIDFYKEFNEHELISGKQCLHTTFTCSKEYIKKSFEMAKEAGAETQLHLSESQYEVDYTLNEYGKRPVELYDELNVLSDDLLVSQAVKLNENEIKLLKENGVRVAHLPISNCEVGGGVSPVPTMLKEDISVGLGTDGYVNNFFEVMRAAFLIHKVHHENPAVMPAPTVHKMATSLGAKAIGFDNIGEIKKGNFADLITIDIACPTPVNKDNLYEQLILFHNPENISEVIVNGKFVKENNKIKEYDIESIKRETRKAAEKLWGDT